MHEYYVSTPTTVLVRNPRDTNHPSLLASVSQPALVATFVFGSRQNPAPAAGVSSTWDHVGSRKPLLALFDHHADINHRVQSSPLGR